MGNHETCHGQGIRDASGEDPASERTVDSEDALQFLDIKNLAQENGDAQSERELREAARKQAQLDKNEWLEQKLQTGGMQETKEAVMGPPGG